MQTQINTALLATKEGIAESLLVAYLIRCQEHPTYLIMENVGVSHGYSGLGSNNPAEQEAVLNVEKHGATLDWLANTKDRPRFVLSFHATVDGKRVKDSHAFTFELEDAPITEEALNHMAWNLVGATFRYIAFATIHRLKDQVNHLAIVRGFVGIQSDQVQE